MGVQVCMLGTNKAFLGEVREACIAAYRECGRNSSEILVLPFEAWESNPMKAAFEKCLDRHSRVDILVSETIYLIISPIILMHDISQSKRLSQS
ncbi:hypothetical protein Ciccas_002996 [Cichlidogyrus casuarinus]|uniref:Uncharacterized protein n=1 Tax=Cichlidogyrus casuarinus TaxID=1844966 RepID=A0ABD2QFN3_9PLAT